MVQHYLPPPPQVHPNYANPSTQFSWSLWLYIFFLVVTTVATALRLYTRLRISRFPLGADDVFCTLAYLLFVGYIALLMKFPSAGIGRHMWEVPFFTLAQAAVYVGVAGFLHLALLACIKMTFLSYYYHYFWLHAPCRRMVIVGMVVVCLTAIAFFTTAAATAVPSLSPAYNRAGEQGLPKAAPYVYGAVDTVTNIYILLVPIPCLRQLPLGFRDKLKVAALFFLGTCACAAGVSILAVTPRIQSNPDLTWTLGITCTLGAVEANIGLLCACLLLFPAFVDGHGPKRLLRSMTGCFRRDRHNDGHSVAPRHPFTSEITSITELNPTHQRDRPDNDECG